MPSSLRLLPRLLTVIGTLLLLPAHAGAELVITPDRADGIYARGAEVAWTVAAAPGSEGGRYRYRITKDWLVPLASGEIDLGPDAVKLAVKLDAPGMVHLDLTPTTDGTARRAAAAVDPTAIPPSVRRPADFERFWAGKIADLQSIPMDVETTAGESGREGVEWATVRMKNILGAHVHGQLAKPARAGTFPAMLILQWAGGPYPLEKDWVTSRAAEGWLVLNVMAHDVPGHLPAEFYAALPQMLKNYNTLYDEDRDRNYFLQMYLGGYRAVDLLAAHPQWDGQILLATGTSMGGQQSLAVAGLHPQITHVIVHVPAGADSNGRLAGRATGYPNWDSERPRVLETAQYFDTVNLAAGIRAKTLISLGFIDDVCPPAGIWAAFNQIPGPKEIVPLVTAAHNHQATEEQQQPYFERMNAWMAALVRGEQPEVRLFGETSGRP